MAVNKLATALAMALACGLSSQAIAQSPQILNNFEEGTTEGWIINFGSGVYDLGASYNDVTETTELRFFAEGAGGAITDNFNNSGALHQPSAGGVDLTGLSAIEMDIRYVGDVPTQNLQFFVQASPSSNYVGMSDVTLTAGVPETITFDLSVLTPAQVAWVRTWGVNVRALPGDYSGAPLQFFIDEVRSVGTPLSSRTYCDFTSSSPDNGFHGMFLNFNGAAVVGNTGQDQSGFSRVDLPDTDGVLQYQQQYAENGEGVPFGPAWSWQNGFNAGFNGRPTDISNYNYIEVDIMVENTSGTSLDVAFFTQSAVRDEFGLIPNFYVYHNHDFQTIQANAGFQTLVFALDKEAATVNASHVMRNGLSFGATVQGEIYTVSVDEIRAVTEIAPPPGLADGFAIY